MPQEHQIAQLLRVAKEGLTYCETIINYPAKVNKRNFDTTSSTDRFYKNIHNLFFNDSLLIVGSLLDEKDKRVISLWNYQEFISQKEKELQNLTDKFSKAGLKTIRDQVVAHQDIGNKSNSFPVDRERGLINPKFVWSLKEILEETIKEFRDFAANHKTAYSDQYFDMADTTQEIEQILEQAKPTLTDNHVIP